MKWLHIIISVINKKLYKIYLFYKNKHSYILEIENVNKLVTIVNTTIWVNMLTYLLLLLVVFQMCIINRTSILIYDKISLWWKGLRKLVELCNRASCDGWLCEWLRIICILCGRLLVANGAVWVVVLFSQGFDGVTQSW